METWIIAVAVVSFVVFAVTLVIVILRFCCSSSKREEEFNRNNKNLQSGIGKLHLAYETNGLQTNNDHDLDNMKRRNYYVLRRELSMKSYFNWADHPSLVSEAVEHGWPRFGFNGHNLSSPSTRSVLLGLCVNGDQARESKAEVSWEISSSSAEFIQKVRMNSGLKKANLDYTSPLGVSCSTQTALPLPGPFLGNSSFPQEAYFEITTLPLPSSRKEKKGEGDKTKLIQETPYADELKLTVNEDDANEVVVVAVSLGLSIAGSHPRRLPGSYTGSIGFNSDGSVYLDGRKVVNETEKAEWGSTSTERVIGCGFDPSQKKVFFTVDSELVHVIHCKSEEYTRPLYPTLAANVDVTVLVNFGQSSFLYAPANIHRTPNPCFMSSVSNGSAAALGYDDSKELFSMGRIDSEWLHRSTTKSSQNTIDKGKFEIDEESETDLFEIVLDNMKRSPSTYL